VVAAGTSSSSTTSTSIGSQVLWYSMNFVLLGIPALVYYIKNSSSASSSNSNNSRNSNPNGIPSSINTFGFGADHDPNLLTTISQKADGVYFFVRDDAHIQKAFASCLGGLVSMVGQNITVQFEPLNGAIIQKIPGKFRERSESGQVHTIQVGDIQSEEQKDILCQLKLPSLKEPEDAFPVARITITYTNSVSHQTESMSSVVSLCRSKKLLPSHTQRNVTVDIELNRIIAAEAMETAVEKGNQDKLDEARQIIDKAMGKIKDSVSGKDPINVSLLEDLQRCRDKLVSQEEYNQAGKHMMMTNASAHYSQRGTSTIGCDYYAGQERYRTVSRFKMGAY